MNGFDGDQLIMDLVSAPTPAARFAALVDGLQPLGIDTVNYGFFDAGAAERAEADILFLTTMSDDWMSHYYDRGLAQRDMHVVRLMSGKMTPYFWGLSTLAKANEGEQRTALEGMEVGLRSGLCVPLASPLEASKPVAAINFGSSLDEAAFRQVMNEHGPALTSIANVLHNTSIRQIWNSQDAGRTLSVRERDCLQFVADGKRHDAIAHSLGIAVITVDVHLRNARKKLMARTLSEAVARGLLFGVLNGPGHRAR